MIQPDPKKLEGQLDPDQPEQTYECFECKHIFQGNIMECETLPDNMMIAGLAPNVKIPKCPHCGKLAFFGFEVVDIAF